MVEGGFGNFEPNTKFLETSCHRAPKIVDPLIGVLPVVVKTKPFDGQTCFL
jgi:hypothetical protein